ncbi:MAG: alpha/beta hydrolase [Leptolyngbya sp. SIO1D8]|nr:alpha/beta hydrolase [Leptolyngbya sp. SIO1D8]
MAYLKAQVGWAVLGAIAVIAGKPFTPASAQSSIPSPLSEIPDPVPVESYTDLPRFEPLDPCFMWADEALSYRCGYVVVPADRSQPGGQTIHLGVFVVESQNSPSSPDPIFFAQGGPGGSVMLFANFGQVIQPDWFTLSNQNRDLVFFDQRGTEYTRPYLSCSDYTDARIQSAQAGASVEQTTEAIATAVETCAQRWEQQGWDLSVFNSLEIAADINDIRLALGYDQINFYGASYGTMLGQHLMYRYPGILRSVTLDGVFPLSGNWGVDQARLKQAALDQAFAACAADAGCHAAYPNLPQMTEQVHANLQQNPLTVSLSPLFEETNTDTFFEVRINGDLFSTALIDSLYNQEGLIRFPFLVDSVGQGNANLLRYEFAHSLQAGDAFALLMHFAVVCAEDADFVMSDVGLSDTSVIAQGYSHLDTRQYLTTCDRLNIASLPASMDVPVVSDVPTLLLSGQFDPATPPSLLDQVLPTLSNAHSYLFPNGAHGQLWPNNACAALLFEHFIDSPRLSPEDRCLELESGSLPFFLPYSNTRTSTQSR